MKTLTFLVCCALAVKSSWCESISIIGSKYIRPNRPYSVAFVNPLNNTVLLKLLLECNDLDNAGFKKESTLRLGSTSGKNVQFPVPSITPTSDCTFSAINDGGKVDVNYNVRLEIPGKTVSIFIQTDKPVYKPGDELRFRVVVVDIETKPVTNVKAIEVLIQDARNDSVRHWTFARLNKGVFETSYQITPVLGTWTISVIANDSSIFNNKTQSVEVREYVLPKFAVKVWPSKTLLIEDKLIRINIESHYTFGQRVQGKVLVHLYVNKDRDKPNQIKDKEINGNTVVEFPLRYQLKIGAEEDYTLVKINVAVTDSVTRETVNMTQLIPVYLKPYKISLVKPSLYYNLGTPYHLKLSVIDHSGLPVEQGKIMKILINGEETKENPLDSQGLVSFIVPMPDEVRNITVSAVFDSVVYKDIGFLKGLESNSTQYFQIQSKQDRIKISKKVSFSVTSNELIAQFTYIIVTRGTIVDFGHIQSRKRKTHLLNLKLTEAMAPKATLVVFFVENGQVIADNFDLNFESFSNDFEFRLNKIDDELYRPDEEIFVEGKAQQDSTIFFQAIDQSALLLGRTEYGLTRQGILDDLDQYRGEGRDNAQDLFDSMGLFFRSDSDVDASGSSRTKRSPFAHQHGQRRVQNAVLLRLDFPESWLWRNSSINKDRMKSFEIQDFVPDTITSWYVTGFALSPTRGLGIMNYPRKFTVGKRFYMIAHLPYSIKRGEVALIQVTLYNFLGNTVTTDVTLFNKNDEIEFVERSSNDDSRRSKAVVLSHHHVKVVSFLIKAKKLGKIAIKMEAVNSLTSDGLEHLLRVIPENRRYKRNVARFIELQGFRNQSFEIACNIPRDSDPGSIKIEAVFDHDLIGIPAEHSESLFNIPNGSGDLNLLTLIPNIVALDYLSSKGSAADETVKQKAVDSLNKGYVNQLKYRSSNGAFRQWIHEVGRESIFLTALVANTFTAAAKYITVDHAVIRDAFSWLANRQALDGCFYEIGEILYSPMQGSSSFVALTAFVVAAFTENHHYSIGYEMMINKAVGCLEYRFDYHTSDYDKALATYALSLTNHPKRANYLNQLVQNSIKRNSERYWNEGSLSVEILGYVLLSYIAQDLNMDGMFIYDWLNRQRLSSGQFAGVQSTFVGLKAIGKMAQIWSRSPVDFHVQIKSKSQPRTWRLDIDRSRALSTTKQELSDMHHVFQIDVSGTGYGFLQLSYQYHRNIGWAKKSFDLNLQLLETSNQSVQNLKVCLNYIPQESNGRSDKAVVEIHLPSGFFVNDYSVEDLSPKREIKNIIRSFDGSIMYVYYSSVGSYPVCFVVTAHRQFKIANHRPSYVVVYDTENRGQFALLPYEGNVLQPCDICEDEDCLALNC